MYQPKCAVASAPKFNLRMVSCFPLGKTMDTISYFSAGTLHPWQWPTFTNCFTNLSRKCQYLSRLAVSFCPHKKGIKQKIKRVVRKKTRGFFFLFRKLKKAKYLFFFMVNKDKQTR